MPRLRSGSLSEQPRAVPELIPRTLGYATSFLHLLVLSFLGLRCICAAGLTGAGQAHPAGDCKACVGAHPGSRPPFPSLHHQSLSASKLFSPPQSPRQPASLWESAFLDSSFLACNVSTTATFSPCYGVGGYLGGWGGVLPFKHKKLRGKAVKGYGVGAKKGSRTPLSPTWTLRSVVQCISRLVLL